MSARVLVIDDETNIRAMIRLALEHQGYRVAVAPDGPEGIQKFGDGVEFDLVLLDQRMPGMTGIEVQKEIYRRAPKTRLILITAFGTIDLALEAIQAGASDFLRKPFTADTLRTAVKSALERPVTHHSAVPVGMACREFTRAAINGFSFELDGETVDDSSGDLSCSFHVTRAGQSSSNVHVNLPSFVKELVLAYTDSETVPGAGSFWRAMCEEELANYLWQNAQLPDGKTLQIDDISPGLMRWLDSVMTVPFGEEDAK